MWRTCSSGPEQVGHPYVSIFSVCKIVTEVQSRVIEAVRRDPFDPIWVSFECRLPGTRPVGER